MAPFPLRLSCVLLWLFALLGPTRVTGGSAPATPTTLPSSRPRSGRSWSSGAKSVTRVRSPNPRAASGSIAALVSARGRSSGPAVVPGDLDASLLYQAIIAADGVVPMPPKARLSPAEIADFRRWITRGAPDPREAPAASRLRPPRPPQCKAAIGGR